MSVNPIHQETIIGEVSIIQEQDKQQTESENRKETDFGKYHRIMKQLEQEGEIVAKQTLTDVMNSRITDISTLTTFMSDGSNRFKKSVGRPMTYGEIREMWG
jgi:hypothetical protein